MSTTVLLSNDDGIDAPGLGALAEALSSLGDVWVVAPDRERSATSHSISLHRSLRIREVGERRFAVDGTPTDAVYLALNHILPRPPDLVVGGVNNGPNLGNDVLYSGTVAVAMEGTLFGHPGLAVSLAANGEVGRQFEVAAEVGVGIAATMLTEPPALGVMLNVNVPPLPRDQIRGIKLCRLGYNDWADAVSVGHDPRGKPYYWIGGDRGAHDDIPDSDNNAISQGFVAVTPIHYDLTDYRSFAYVRRKLQVDGFATLDDCLGDGPIEYPPHPRSS